MQLEACVFESFSQQSARQVYVTRACSPAQVCRPVPHGAARVGYSRTRRQQSAALSALPKSATTVRETNVGSESYEQRLHALSSFSVPELRQYIQQCPDDVSLDFLQWLASR